MELNANGEPSAHRQAGPRWRFVLPAGSAGVNAACGDYDRHPDENWLAAPICHLSRFALFGKYTVYLPLVLRNS